MTYFEYLQQRFNHARDKLPDSYTVDDIAIHVLKSESHSSPEYLQVDSRRCLKQNVLSQSVESM